MKTGQDVITICKTCSKKVPMGSLRYHWKLGEFVCQDCYEGKKQEFEKKVELPNQERVDYKCTSCGYSFSRSKGFQVSPLCFFCGKESVVREDKADANIKIIKEIDNGLQYNSKEL